MARKALILLAAAMLAIPAAAQTLPDGLAFIKAVRDADGGKATALLNGNGSTVAGARDAGTGENALHIAVRRRDAPWTGFMVGRGVDPNALDKAGDTPLGLAARLGFIEGARALIAGGARVDAGNARGETPLILAVQNHKLDMVQLLMRQGANPDKPDSAAGYSARDYAGQDRRSATILRALDEKRGAVAKAAPAKAAPAKAPARAQ